MKIVAGARYSEITPDVRINFIREVRVRKRSIRKFYIFPVNSNCAKQRAIMKRKVDSGVAFRCS